MSLSASQVEQLYQRAKAALKKEAAAAPVKVIGKKDRSVVREVEPDHHSDEDVAVGLHGVLSATEKLLAVNRGLVPTDERDSLQFKRLHTTDQLMRERAKLDAGKTRLNVLRRASKTRNLSGIHPGHFDEYTEGHLIGNPLSAPGEEMNPLALVESARRITQMGPGGLGSSEAITDEARALHPSQFGFISAIEGPESERIGIDTRLAWGAKIGSDGKLYQRFFDNRSNKYRWMSPTDLDGLTVGLPD